MNEQQGKTLAGLLLGSAEAPVQKPLTPKDRLLTSLFYGLSDATSGFESVAIPSAGAPAEPIPSAAVKEEPTSLELAEFRLDESTREVARLEKRMEMMKGRAEAERAKAAKKGERRDAKAAKFQEAVAQAMRAAKSAKKGRKR